MAETPEKWSTRLCIAIVARLESISECFWSELELWPISGSWSCCFPRRGDPVTTRTGIDCRTPADVDRLRGLHRGTKPTCRGPFTTTDGTTCRVDVLLHCAHRNHAASLADAFHYGRTIPYLCALHRYSSGGLLSFSPPLFELLPHTELPGWVDLSQLARISES